MNPYLKYQGKKHTKNDIQDIADDLAIEQPLEISINGEPYTVVMQTPGNEKELAIGLLYAEDVIKDITDCNFKLDANKINITLPVEKIRKGLLSSRSLLSVSSCGICGKKSLDDIAVKGDKMMDQLTIKAEIIYQLSNELSTRQILFKKTGGTHAIAAFDKVGKHLSTKEDVGRHNALDKVIGNLLQNGRLSRAIIIFCSGRLSYEIVSKAFRAKIKIVVAVSAPTSLAVDFAKEYGITLIAFTRENKFTCYSNPYRITT